MQTSENWGTHFRHARQKCNYSRAYHSVQQLWLAVRGFVDASVTNLKLAAAFSSNTLEQLPLGWDRPEHLLVEGGSFDPKSWKLNISVQSKLFYG